METSSTTMPSSPQLTLGSWSGDNTIDLKDYGDLELDYYITVRSESIVQGYLATTDIKVEKECSCPVAGLLC